MTTAINVPLNADGYKKLREDISAEISRVANSNVVAPHREDLVKVYSAVFATALKQIEVLTLAGADGADLEDYFTIVAGTIVNAGLAAEKIQAKLLFVDGFADLMREYEMSKRKESTLAKGTAK